MPLRKALWQDWQDLGRTALSSRSDGLIVGGNAKGEGLLVLDFTQARRSLHGTTSNGSGAAATHRVDAAVAPVLSPANSLGNAQLTR